MSQEYPEMSDTDEPRLRKIEETLTRAVVLLENLNQKVEEEQERNAEWKKDTDTVIWGTGNGTKGLLVRLDRVEQRHESGRWLRRVFTVAVVGMLVNSVYAMIVG